MSQIEMDTQVYAWNNESLLCKAFKSSMQTKPTMISDAKAE